MRRLIFAAGFAFCVTACSQETPLPSPTSPSPVPAPVPPAPPPVPPSGSQAARVILVGERVQETLIGHGSERRYDITPTADGTLQMHIAFERKRGLVEVWVDDKYLVADDDGQLLAEVAVRAGRTYRLWVGDGAPWDYGDWSLPFEMITSLER